MVNLLLSGCNFDKSFIAPALKKHLYKAQKVSIVGFSFGEECKCSTDWESNFGKDTEIRKSIENAFASFGIRSEHIFWINYYEDTYREACEKISISDILFLPGGLPDKMMERIREFHLQSIIEDFKGMVIGCSAGALIQAKDYFISPDNDYKNYMEERGLTFITDFAVEVHYRNTKEQRESIRRYIEKREKPVYGIGEEGGVLVEEGKVSLYGEVEYFPY